jgi:3(or 17)beta-hydroxysteroid dehydrogenase
VNRVDGKVALITGGGAGLGKSTCELLAHAGAKVVVTGRNLPSVEETANTIVNAGGDAIAVKHDISIEADWARVIAQTQEKFGRLDVLVNNAAISEIGRECRNTSLENWRTIHCINLDGTFMGVRSAIQVMAGNSEPGSIINVSSIYGVSGDGDVSYSSSKGGIRTLTKAVAIECGKMGYNIRVNAIYPGPIDSPMSTEVKKSEGWKMAMSMFPLGRPAQPIEVAKGILFLASDDSSYMTGSELVIDGGISAGFGGMGLSFDT